MKKTLHGTKPTSAAVLGDGGVGKSSHLALAAGSCRPRFTFRTLMMYATSKERVFKEKTIIIA